MEGPELRDFVVAISFAVCFIAAHWFLDKLLFRRIAIWVLGCGHGRSRVPLKVANRFRAKIRKFSESLWKFTYYAAVEMCILWVIYHKPWLTNVKECFRGWPNQELELSLLLFNMCQCGFYLYSIVSLVTWETRRKDFAVMMCHHVITVILIGYSYLAGFFRLASITLALHDASDIFMEVAKLFKYSGVEIGASVFFGLFAISWVILRLIIFPFWIIRGTSYDILEVLPMSEAYGFYTYYIFNTLLITLLVFHIYWWILIYRMIEKQLYNKGKVGEDIRSDSEEDDGDA
ncbi:hypothetical protein MLD38_032106 [Melastoma candidum]|uniref:Uncharacterized protein n=1 Tax=Melastoma candidum TaxID=119954 RepID=A0ACB9M393_9MYRT|nr:hypothetical protein MLD38_032106 [Melastoma candidum]